MRKLIRATLWLALLASLSGCGYNTLQTADADQVELGSLRCRFAEPARKLLPSRWPLRSALQSFHEV